MTYLTQSDLTDRAQLERSLPALTKKAGTRRTLGASSKRWIYGILSLVVVFGGYTIYTMRPDNNAALVPSPLDVANAFGSAVADGTLVTALFSSMQLVMTGYLIGSALGIIVGSMIGWYKVAEYLLDPLIELLRPIPPLAYIPLVLVWFGINFESRALVLIIACFVTSVINVSAGMREVPAVYVNAAATMGSSRTQTFFYVALPSALPYIFTGLRISLAAAWTTLVAAELLAAQSGLGYQLQIARQFFRTDQVVMIIITIGVLAFLMDRIVRYAQRRLTSWSEVSE